MAIKSIISRRADRANMAFVPDNQRQQSIYAYKMYDKTNNSRQQQKRIGKRKRRRKQTEIESRQAKMLYRLPAVYASFFILCTTIPKMLFFGSVQESVQNRRTVAIATS